jgi:hypothetical protein
VSWQGQPPRFVGENELCHLPSIRAYASLELLQALGRKKDRAGTGLLIDVSRSPRNSIMMPAPRAGEMSVGYVGCLTHRCNGAICLESHYGLCSRILRPKIPPAVASGSA